MTLSSNNNLQYLLVFATHFYKRGCAYLFAYNSDSVQKLYTKYYHSNHNEGMNTNFVIDLIFYTV